MIQEDKREEGYYWVLDGDEWFVAKWNGDCWTVPGWVENWAMI